MRNTVTYLVVSFAVRWLFLHFNGLVLDEPTNKMYFGTFGAQMWTHRFYYVLFTLFADSAYASSFTPLSIFLAAEIVFTGYIFGLCYIKFVVVKCIFGMFWNCVGDRLMIFFSFFIEILSFKIQTFIVQRKLTRISDQLTHIKQKTGLSQVSNETVIEFIRTNLNNEHPKYVQSAQVLHRGNKTRTKNPRDRNIDPSMYD